MDDIRTVPNMQVALTIRAHPAITRWNRLEGRPRSHDFSRALRAEVRDALWMLSRQWQLGEFAGEDAGSPAFVRVVADLTRIDAYHAATSPFGPLDGDLPLDATVEGRPAPLRAGAQYLSLDLRLVVGRRWLMLLEAFAAEPTGLSADYRGAYRTAYAIDLPDPTDRAQAAVASSREAWQVAAAVAGGRAMDGIALLEHAGQPGNSYFDDVAAAAADRPILTQLGDELAEWFRSLVVQPEAGVEDAWQPSRLEYRFGVAAPDGGGSLTLEAQEYVGGRLDWYSLDRGPAVAPVAGGAAAERLVRTVLPTSVVFDGMPATRWWAFEDRRTNFGDVRPDTTDLAKLLMMEFALVYANDWFVVPIRLDIGQIADVHGVAVTNVFGEREWITRAPVDVGDGNRWAVFTMAPATGAEGAGVSSDPRLVLLPTAAGVQESSVTEEIALIRDEVANMVWAVERRVPSPSGTALPGSEAGRQTRAYHDRLAEAAVEAAGGTAPGAPPEPVAPIRYLVQTTVPEHWIPFIPVHISGDSREIQLQRAALPRILVDGTHDRVAPRTVLLGDVPPPYFLFEEEVPRAGIQLRQVYRRARWHDGAVATWLSFAKGLGRGEGSSGLRFDSLISPPTSPE
jgi:hypothetical protein